MIRFVVIIAFIAAACQGASLPQLRHAMRQRNIFPSGRIVGGNVTTVNDVPWQVSLEDSGFLFCGGSILSANYILTAAHCTDGTPARSIQVRSGSSTLESGGSTTQVASLVQNPNFTEDNLDFDASVLKLSEPLVLGPTRAAITLRSVEASSNETARVSGWGTLDEDDFDLPTELHAVNVPVVDRATCTRAYSRLIDITARMICAGEEGKDSCQGDSGGAITIGGQQVGIVSFGVGCAEQGYPGVYSNTASTELKNFIITNSNNEAQYT